MKRHSLFLLRSVLIALLLLLAGVSTAAAEEGETPQIALSVYQASPGATIEITGGRFEEDILVTLVLFKDGAQTELGSTLADDHGEFFVAILLPYELQAGEYEFRAIDEKSRTAVAPLAIVADASGMEESGERDDADGLLAPMPTAAAAVSTQVSDTAPSAGGATSSIVWIIAGVGVLLLLGLLRIMRK